MKKHLSESEQRSRLLSLSKGQLVEALLELANKHDAAEKAIEDLCSSPDDAIAAFKRKLSGLKRRQTFYPRSKARAFANELVFALKILEKPDLPAKDVLQALLLFFQADAKIMMIADDSNGDIGYVFKTVATQLFAKIASKITDQHFLKKLFIKLYQENKYGLRDRIVSVSNTFLTPETISELIEHYSKPTGEDYPDLSAGILRKGLCFQLADPPLFEAELRKHNENYYRANILELCQVYIDADQKHELAARIPEFLELIGIYERSQLEMLAVTIYLEIEELEMAKELLIAMLMSNPSLDLLTKLKTLAKAEEVEKVLFNLLESETAAETLSIEHLSFLQEIGNHELASTYLLNHSDQVSSFYYSSLLPIAESFEENGFPLATILILRSLSDEILERGYNKAYVSVVKYLKREHRLAPMVRDWLEFETHEAYLKNLHEAHYRKTSLWKHVPETILTLASTN